MTARFLPDVSPDEYHKRLGFSSSVAKVLLDRSPAHARHYQLNGSRPATDATNTGAIRHALVLGKGARYKVIDHDEYRTNAAKADRDAALAAGIIPVKRKDVEEHERAAMAVTEQLAERGLTLTGASELAMEWEEPTSRGAVLCRGMMDHAIGIDPDRVEVATIIDLKFMEDASPNAVQSYAERYGFGVQHAAYTSGLAKVMPSRAGRVRMLFVACEHEDPYRIAIYEPDGVFRELGDARWRRAVATWSKCLEDDEFPAYVDTNLTAPVWALRREGFTAEEM